MNTNPTSPSEDPRSSCSASNAYSCGIQPSGALACHKGAHRAMFNDALIQGEPMTALYRERISETIIDMVDRQAGR